MSKVTVVSAQRRRALKLAWWRYRRPALLLGTALTVVVGYRIAAPGGPELVPVTVAARDLAAGSVVSAADVRTVSWPKSSAPEALPAGVVGATLASPLLTGEAITSTRLVGRSLLTGQPGGTVAVAVRLADPSGISIVRSGDRVDVLAAGSTSSAASPYGSPVAQRVATSALVLAAPGASGAESSTGAGSEGLGLLDAGSGSSGSSGAPVLVVAVDQATAGRLAAAQGDRLLSVVLLADGSSPVGNPAGQALPDPASLGGVPAG